MESGKKFTTVEEYHGMWPEDIQAMLQQMRDTITQAAPEAEEGIFYNMPGYKLHGPLAYYAAYKNHIGFYPIPSGIEAFQKELSPYKCTKGAVQFPLDKPLPLKLVAKIVKWRVKDNKEKEMLKKAAKKK
ncbi:MAG: DUF1801 domain-containing protein [Sphingobacteriales bacterium]|nr:MAG: DUF1801 domain-containing protein [Sphingobacteriales bacterium]